MNEAKGSARELKGRWYARARYGENRRIERAVPWAKTREDAVRVAVLIAELATALADAHRSDLIGATADDAAAARSSSDAAKLRKAIGAIVRGAVNAGAGRSITFEAWARRWTSGELSRLHPDHVPVKDWSDDVSRLRKYINPHVGNVPVHAFTIAHGDLVMTKLPLEKVTSRRHVAQVMSRVLALAVYPGRLIAANPLPRTWMPKLGKAKRRHYSCLWPREDALLMRHAGTPLAFRLFCGVLNREGMRLSELADSEWPQWNLEEGTFRTTKTKTNDPRMWALSPDVLEAMRRWRELNPRLARPFAGLVGGEDKTHIAETFRAALRAAGVTRPELFEDTEYSGKLRAHDMRATFVTVSLANGKSEAWIADRTGHKSSAMINRYRRAARQHEELQLGALERLDVLLGLSSSVRGRSSRKPGGKPGGRKRP